MPSNEAETGPDFHLYYENFQRVRFDFKIKNMKLFLSQVLLEQ